MLSRPRPQSQTDTAATDRPYKRPVTAGLLLHLLFTGLVGATTVTLLAVACLAFLSTGNEPITRFRVDGRVADGSVEPEAGQRSARQPDELGKHSVLLPQTAGTSEASADTGLSRSFELQSSDRGGDIAAEAPGTFPNWDRSAGAIDGVDVTGSVPLATQAPRDPEPSITPDDTRSVVTEMPPPEVGGRIGREVEKQQDQPINLNQNNLASDTKIQAEKLRVPRRPVQPNANLRNRMQKECGSIIFPALRRHCLASFGTRYR